MEAKDVVCGANEIFIKRYPYEKVTSKKNKQFCEEELILTNKRLIHRTVVEEKKKLQTQTEEVSLDLIDSVEASFLKVKAKISILGLIISIILMVGGIAMMIISNGKPSTNLWIGIGALAVGLIALLVTIFSRRKEASFSLSVNNIFRCGDLVEHMDLKGIMKAPVEKKKRNIARKIVGVWMILVAISSWLCAALPFILTTNSHRDDAELLLFIIIAIVCVCIGFIFFVIGRKLVHNRRISVANNKMKYITVFNSSVVEEMVNEIGALITEAKENNKENKIC